MRKNKRISLILVILIIILIIFIISRIFIAKDNQTQKLAQIYENINSSNTYVFEIEQNNKNKMIMAKKDTKTMIDQYTKDSHTTTLIKDNNTYLILHDRTEYYVYEQNNIEQNILSEGLKEIIDKEFTTGNEKIKGKKYNYEEYSGSTMFMMTSILDLNESDINTRFYFDKNNNLTYIKTIYGEEQELLKVNLEKEADDSIFEIPANYAEN